jgi:hypothetical protein
VRHRLPCRDLTEASRFSVVHIGHLENESVPPKESQEIPAFNRNSG